jgi:uracil DNA glycosylase
MTPPIPAGWQPILAGETEKPYYHKLQLFLAQERSEHTIFSCTKASPTPPSCPNPKGSGSAQ